MDTDSSQVTYPPIPATAPFLFENQHLPFAGDIHMEGEMIKLRDQFNLDTFVETGTCYGSTTLWAAQHFRERPITMEVNEAFLGVAQGRFSEAGAAITSQLGDSAAMMPACCEAIKSSGQSALFFLDAHFEAHCPLLQELAAIAAAGLRPVIIVHDMMVPGRPDLGYDTWEGQKFTFAWLRPHLDRIYGNNLWGHHFNNLATGAKRGVLYAYPII